MEIIQVYASTTNHGYQAVEEFYGHPKTSINRPFQREHPN